MPHTLRATVCDPEQLARLVATLHQRDVHPTYFSYREDAYAAGAEAVFVIADENAAARAKRALERVVSVSRVTIDAPARSRHVVRVSPHEAREATRMRDAFARLYR